MQLLKENVKLQSILNNCIIPKTDLLTILYTVRYLVMVHITQVLYSTCTKHHSPEGNGQVKWFVVGGGVAVSGCQKFEVL